MRDDVLLMDLGNSALKWAWRRDVQKIRRDRISGRCFGEDCFQELGELPRPSQVWLSSVADEKLTQSLLEWVRNQWAVDVSRAVVKASECGVVNGYDRPDELGVDRWLGMIGARDLVGGAVLVVDCGTATTIDGLDALGRHVGGLILPGIATGRGCLYEKTSIKPAHDLSDLSGLFMRATHPAIAAGAIASLVALIEKMYVHLEGMTASRVDCIITGGEAELIAQHLDLPVIIEPALVFTGLKLISNRVST